MVRGRLAERFLEPRALAHIEDCLRGGNTLSRCISRSVPLDCGQVTTYLPQGVGQECAHDFTHGGKMAPQSTGKRSFRFPWGETGTAVPVSDTTAWLASMVVDFLAGSPDRVFLVEDRLARPGDACLASARARILFHRDEVYHLLTGPAVSGQLAAKVIGQAGSFPTFTAVMGTQATGVLAEASRTISRVQLAALAKAVERVVVMAYDGESYLVWRRTQTSPHRQLTPGSALGDANADYRLVDRTGQQGNSLGDRDAHRAKRGDGRTRSPV